MNEITVFNYDVFISYKSEEESWAKRLAKTLRDFGLNVWRDHDPDDGIPVSRAWSPEVKAAIRASKIMLVLWSKRIATDVGTVVLQEVNEMNDLIQNDQTGTRKFVPVLLDGTPVTRFPALSPFQADTSFQNLYVRHGEGGAEKVSAIEWYGSIKPLVQALGIRDVMEVRFVVAAMTKSQAIELENNPDQVVRDKQTYLKMLAMMNMTSPYSVDRYGNSPNDWKPFPQLGNQYSIWDLINTFDDEKRGHMQGRKEPAKWILVSYSDEIIAPDPSQRVKARQALSSGPYLVIVDPISLMHKNVYDNIIGLQNHKEVSFIGIAPFVSQMHRDLYNSSIELEAQLEQSLQDAYYRFKQYFEPETGACVMGVEHEHQFIRWLQITADNIVRINKTPMQNRTAKVNAAQLQRLARVVGTSPGPEVVNMSGIGGSI